MGGGVYSDGLLTITHKKVGAWLLCITVVGRSHCLYYILTISSRQEGWRYGIFEFLTSGNEKKCVIINRDEKWRVKLKRERISVIKQDFDSIVKIEQGVECWTARELMSRLGYDKWENFEKVIERAVESCIASKIEPSDHFRRVIETVITGKNTPKERADYLLTRYACYLIAQNGDPKKEEIAFAQGYFAVQTRKQELIEERIAYIERVEARGRLRESEKQLSKNIYERGVDDAGFARIRSKGDTALFGGLTTQQMKDRMGVKSKRPLADFLPTLTITAKNLATEIASFGAGCGVFDYLRFCTLSIRLSLFLA